MKIPYKIKFSILFCVVVFTFQQVAMAQWEQLNGPRSEVINCLNYKDSLLFAGGNGFYVSADSGLHWINKSNGLSGPYSNPCNVKAIEKTSDAILVGTSKYGIFRTIDYGNSWTPVNTGIPISDITLGFYADIIGIIKSDSIVVAATYSKIYYSQDDGLSWQNANGLPPNCYILHLAKKDTILYASNCNGGILKSIDNGINWSLLSNNPSASVRNIATNSTSIFAATDTCTLYISNDDGNTWQILNTGISNSYIYSFNVLGNEIFIGTKYGLHYSSDNGITWNIINNQICPAGFNTMLYYDSTLFCANSLGIFISADNGITWKMNNDGLTAAGIEKVIPFSNKIYCLSAGLMFSADSGNTWSYINKDINSYYIDIAVLDDTLIAIDYQSGVFFSSDYGISWHLKNNGISCYPISIAISNHDIFITTDSCGLYKSSDMGNTWISVNNGIPIYDQKIITANDSLVMLSYWGSQVYQSYNSGATWTLLSFPSGASDINIRNNGIIIVDYFQGVFISIDYGHTWSKINSGIPESIVTQGFFSCSVGATDGNNFFIGTELQGIYKLVDTVWVPINLGLPSCMAYIDTVFCPNMYNQIVDITISDSFVYAGFNPGLWKRALSDININKHSGNIFADINNNNIKDSTDYGMPYVMVEMKTGGGYYTSNSDGNYNAYTEYFLDTLQSIIPSPYATVNPPYYLVTQPDSGKNFAVHFIPDIKDLRVTVTNFTDANPGFNSTIRITYKNMGTDTMDGTVKLVFVDSLDFVSSNPAYTSLSSDTLFWDFNDLKPFESRNINIVFYVPIGFLFNSDSVFLSDSLLFSAYILPVIGDTVPSDNSDSIYQYIFSAYDPNSTEVFPQGCITPADIAAGEKFVYTIRFQNTGTDTATNIVIIDTLDQNLYVPSFEFLSASHAYTYSIKGNGIAEFSFQNIFLPDSNVNEPLSHGFVKFSIKPKSDVQPGNVIQNKADIYFDFNLPIVTNTTLNPVQSVCGGTILPNENDQPILIFPNPSSNYITVALSNNNKPIIEIYDIEGRLIFRKQSTTEHYINIDVSRYSSGVYFIKAIFGASVESGKFLVQ